MAAISFAYTNKSHELMRETPDKTSKVVSDTFFSEAIEIIKQVGKWLYVRTKVDGYPGWVREKSIVRQENDFFTSSGSDLAKTNRLAAFLYSEPDTERGPILTLPFGSHLKASNGSISSQERWIKVTLQDNREAYVQRGDVTFDLSPISQKEVVIFAKKFLELPYSWGGRSSFGYDCSGFTQMLYREMGILIPRDAKDQFGSDLFLPVNVDQLQKGDLIFWGAAQDKIRHVGMYIGDDQFIHSTVRDLKPRIQISSLSDETWKEGGACAFREARTLKPKSLGDESKQN